MSLVVTVPGIATTPQHVEAMTEMEAVGLGWIQWLIDQVSVRPDSEARAAPCGSFDVENLPLITRAEVEALLVPIYVSEVPEFDPWGHEYEYRMAGDLLGPNFSSLRSAGADGLFEGTNYLGGYTAGADDDLVWRDFGWLRRQPLGGAVERQSEAGADLRNIGTATMSWITDQASLVLVDLPARTEAVDGVAGTIDMGDYPPIDAAALASLLVPQYISCLPEFDPWGNAYDFRLDPDLQGAQVTAIRSAARDSTYEADVYPLGAFGIPPLKRST
jgi:hypothetical protein